MIISLSIKKLAIFENANWHSTKTHMHKVTLLQHFLTVWNTGNIHRRVNKQDAIFWILNTPLTWLCFSPQLPPFFCSLKSKILGNICLYLPSQILIFPSSFKTTPITFYPTGHWNSIQRRWWFPIWLIQLSVPSSLLTWPVSIIWQLITPSSCKYFIHLDSGSSHSPMFLYITRCSSPYLLCLRSLLSLLYITVSGLSSWSSSLFPFIALWFHLVS